MEQINASELALRANVGRSAVSNAVKRGRIKPGIDGLFDVTDPDVRDFINYAPARRRLAQRQKAQEGDSRADLRQNPSSTQAPATLGRERGPSKNVTSLPGGPQADNGENSPAGIAASYSEERGPVSGKDEGDVLPSKPLSFLRAGIDPASPAVLDLLDALHEEDRPCRVDWPFVVILVTAIYSRLQIAPQDEDGYALEPYELADAVTKIFQDWCKTYLNVDLSLALALAEAELSEKRGAP